MSIIAGIDVLIDFLNSRVTAATCGRLVTLRLAWLAQGRPATGHQQPLYRLAYVVST